MSDQMDTTETPADRRAALLDLLVNRGLVRLDTPVELASGVPSRYFLDGKKALSSGRDLALACRCMADIAADAGIAFDAVGGLTLGADQFAHGIAIVAPPCICPGHPRQRVGARNAAAQGFTAAC